MLEFEVPTGLRRVVAKAARLVVRPAAAARRARHASAPGPASLPTEVRPNHRRRHGAEPLPVERPCGAPRTRPAREAFVRWILSRAFYRGRRGGAPVARRPAEVARDRRPGRAHDAGRDAGRLLRAQAAPRSAVVQPPQRLGGGDVHQERDGRPRHQHGRGLRPVPALVQHGPGDVPPSADGVAAGGVVRSVRAGLPVPPS